MSTVQIVQITFPRNDKWSVAEREKATTFKFPRQYTELRNAFEAVFKALKSHIVCGACFKGDLDRDRKGRGCCGDCSALSTKGCTSKPVACASFAHCGHMHKLFGRELWDRFDRLNQRWLQIRWDEEGWGNHPYHISGYCNDAEIKWTRKQLREMDCLSNDLSNLLVDLKAGAIKSGVAAKVIVDEAIAIRKQSKAMSDHYRKYGYWPSSSVYAPDTSRATA